MLIPNSAKFDLGDMYVHNSCNIGISGLPAMYLPMLQLICYIYLRADSISSQKPMTANTSLFILKLTNEL